MCNKKRSRGVLQKKKKKVGGKRMEKLAGKEKLWQKCSEGRLQSKGEINKETL